VGRKIQKDVKDCCRQWIFCTAEDCNRGYAEV